MILRLRLFYLIKRWTLLFVLGVSFASCIKGDNKDLLGSDDAFISPLDNISAYITAKRTVMDDNDKTPREGFCKENFPEAHVLFKDVQKSLKIWSNSTRYSIAQSILMTMRGKLIELEKDIDDLPDGRDKNQFREEWNQLHQAVDALVSKKDVSQSAATRPSPAA